VGDVLSERLASLELAQLVSAGDVEGVADAILSMLSNPSLRVDSASTFRRMAARYRWDVVLRPLVEFCMDPYLAPDKSYLRLGGRPTGMQDSPWRLVRTAWRALRLGGISDLIRLGSQRLRWGLDNRGLFKD
jgi:hypothetical protein